MHSILVAGFQNSENIGLYFQQGCVVYFIPKGEKEERTSTQKYQAFAGNACWTESTDISGRIVIGNPT